LEQAWQVDADGNFVRPLTDGQGVWISHDVMTYVHFLERPETSDGSEQH
jgi:hypothetical protein